MVEDISLYSLCLLFANSFLAATILPFGSEATFIGLLSLGLNPWLCLWTASIGNTLGGMTNYFIGRLGKIEWAHKYLHISADTLTRYQHKLRHQSAWIAFFCFMPIIGDPLALALGFIRVNLLITVSAMFLGKFVRYLALSLPFI